MTRHDFHGSEGKIARANTATLLRHAIAVMADTGRGLIVVYPDGTTALVANTSEPEPATYRGKGRA